MNRKKCILIILSGIFAVGFAVAGLMYGCYQGYIRINYPSLTEYPVQGIDVSHHQGAIDWATLDKRYVQFAFIKATEGGDHKDTLFQDNWIQAKQNNIRVGAYHFFSFCKGGDEQARNYIHYVGKDSADLPPIIDLEYGGNCQEANRKKDIISEIEIFIQIIENHYQKKVIIYTTNEFYKNYLTNKFPDNPIWIRDIISRPKLPDGRKWCFWQFANRGKLEGINTFVDLNAFYGSKEEFETFVH